MTNNTKKTFYTLNIIIFACAMVCLVCYDIFGGLWLKGFTSCWFVLLGMTNLIYAKKAKIKIMPFPALMASGLVLGMCADILLGIHFMTGIVCFAAGHILYLTAFYSLEKPCLRDLFIILPIAAVSLFIVSGTPYIKIDDPVMKKMLLGYAVVIACMLGKAISNFISEKSIYRLLILTGSVMFWFSDVMLAIDMFGQASRMTWILCSYTYWPAQNILAFALFHFVNEKDKDKIYIR